MSVLPVGFGSTSASTAYQIDNSLRFDGVDDYLSRTFGTALNNKIWTVSLWVKRAKLGAQQGFLSAWNPGVNYGLFEFNSSDKIRLIFDAVSNYGMEAATPVWRDVTAWYHIVVAVDVTAGSGQRVKLWVNGVAQTLTAISGYSEPPNANTFINGVYQHNFGRFGYTAGAYTDGYLSDIYFIDGQALTPSDFAETNAEGVWVPKAYSGTYGTNGLHLDFADGTSTTTLGYDAAGSNDWTLNGMTLAAGTSECWMTDTPTNNFAVWSPLDKSTGGGTLKEANLAWNSDGGASAYRAIKATIPLKSKTYWEVLVPSTRTYFSPGIMRQDQSPPSSGGSYWIGGGSGPLGAVGYLASDGDVYVNGSVVVAGATPASGDIVGFAFDPATGELWVSLNGTWLNSGNPDAGTGEVYTVSTAYDWAAALTDATTQDTYINFGQYPFHASATYDSTAGGYFRYPPSTNNAATFKALCTANLPSGSLTTSGSFTGNSSTDGPFVWLNGNPTAMTINGNAVTFGTHADKTAGGFKVINSTSSYNSSGSNTFSVTSSGELFNAPNTAQGNP